MKQIVERISEGVDSDQRLDGIEKLLSVEALQDHVNAGEKMIKDLSSSLNDREIEQLSQILTRVIYDATWLSAEHLRAILFLHTNETPLQPLENKLRDKYAKVLEIDSNGDVRAISLVEEFLSKTKRTKLRTDSEGDDEPTISLTINIQRVKLSKVQRFSWGLNEHATLDKFGFEKAFVDAGPTNRIRASSTEAHLEIVRQCFELISHDTNERTKALISNAMESPMQWNGYPNIWGSCESLFKRLVPMRGEI
ncbi:MAG: hypothetical protein MMC23_003058 [Stictis urceolatum]|nr:hypothetical protein [Stictis urceolata]